MSATKKSVKRYVLLVRGCVEPELVGPFASARYRDGAARRFNDSNGNGQHGVFWLNVKGGNVQVGAYSNGFMERQPGFPGSEG